jgi:hypothetical protein
LVLFNTRFLTPFLWEKVAFNTFFNTILSCFIFFFFFIFFPAVYSFLRCAAFLQAFFSSSFSVARYKCESCFSLRNECKSIAHYCGSGENGRPHGNGPAAGRFFWRFMDWAPIFEFIKSISKRAWTYLFISSPPSSEASGAFGEVSPGAQLLQVHPSQQHETFPLQLPDHVAGAFREPILPLCRHPRPLFRLQDKLFVQIEHVKVNLFFVLLFAFAD